MTLTAGASEQLSAFEDDVIASLASRRLRERSWQVREQACRLEMWPVTSIDEWTSRPERVPPHSRRLDRWSKVLLLLSGWKTD